MGNLTYSNMEDNSVLQTKNNNHTPYKNATVMYNTCTTFTNGSENGKGYSYYKSLSDEEFKQLLLDYISPKFYHWIFIVLFFIVFVVGITGNLMVCYSVWRSSHLKTVTNYFLANLAVADFLVLLICLPPSVIQDVTQSWFLGAVMCKIFVYLQVGLEYFVGPVFLTRFFRNEKVQVCIV